MVDGCVDVDEADREGQHRGVDGLAGHEAAEGSDGGAYEDHFLRSESVGEQARRDVE